MENVDVILAIAWLLMIGCVIFGSIMGIRAYLKKRNTEWVSQHKRKYWLSFSCTIVVILYLVSLSIFCLDEVGLVYFKFLYWYPTWLGKDATAIMGYIIIPGIMCVLSVIGVATYQSIEEAEKKEKKEDKTSLEVSKG